MGDKFLRTTKARSIRKGTKATLRFLWLTLFIVIYGDIQYEEENI